MTNFGELISQISRKLASRKTSIFEDWKNRVREDREIESSQYMPETVLEDNVPELLDVIVKAVDESEENNLEEIASLTFLHTKNRTENNYSAAEIAREYQLLKKSLFNAIREDLNKLSGKECQDIIYKIDAIIDIAILISFKIFVQERVKTFEEVSEELSITSKELNRLLEINRDHFSYLAHDLKTPLNSIMGYAQILLNKQQELEDKKNDRDVQNLNRVLRSSRELLQMVNDLLEVFRYDKSDKKIRLGSFDIRSVINILIENLEPLAREKGLELIKDYEDAPQKIISDISLMRKIISNLLSNAIRYTDEGHVTVSAETVAEDKWVLTVADTGIGIAEEDKNKIFQPFVRTSSNEIRKGSTGLGLAIVAQLVKLLQGEIELVSEVDKGSIFTVTFPLEVTP